MEMVATPLTVNIQMRDGTHASAHAGLVERDQAIVGDDQLHWRGDRTQIGQHPLVSQRFCGVAHKYLIR